MSDDGHSKNEAMNKSRGIARVPAAMANMFTISRSMIMVSCYLMKSLTQISTNVEEKIACSYTFKEILFQTLKYIPRIGQIIENEGGGGFVSIHCIQSIHVTQISDHGRVLLLNPFV